MESAALPSRASRNCSTTLEPLGFGNASNPSCSGVPSTALRPTASTYPDHEADHEMGVVNGLDTPSVASSPGWNTMPVVNPTCGVALLATRPSYHRTLFDVSWSHTATGSVSVVCGAEKSDPSVQVMSVITSREPAGTANRGTVVSPPWKLVDWTRPKRMSEAGAPAAGTACTSVQTAKGHR